MSVGYGLPYPWTGKHAGYRSLGGDGPPEPFDAEAVWSFDGVSFLLDVAFWVCLSVVLVMPALWLVRSRRARSGV